MNKNSIINWLKKNNHNENFDYEIIELKKSEKMIQDYYEKRNNHYDYIVNIDGDVYLDNRKLTCLPFQFHVVCGWFTCEQNSLKNCVGFPQIYNSKNNIHNELRVSGNLLTSLEGLPDFLNASLLCRNNPIKSLLGVSKIINGNFDVTNCWLKDLEYGPRSVNGYYHAQGNPIKSLDFLPKYCNTLEIVRRKDIHDWNDIGRLHCLDMSELSSWKFIQELEKKQKDCENIYKSLMLSNDKLKPLKKI